MSLAESNSEREELIRTLLRQARNGCAEALQMLIEEHHDYLRAVVRRHMAERLRTAFDSTDLLQELRLRVFTEKLPTEVFDSRDRLLAYLSKIAQNLTLTANQKHLQTAKRSLWREVPFHELGIDAVADDPATACEMHDEWTFFCASLPPLYRAVVERLAEGYSEAEISSQMAITTGIIRRIVDRVREKLLASANR